jgi:flavin-dependent thymidylate synthase
LLGHYGGDIEHALSAWTSTSRELSDDKRKRIPKLLEQLAKEGHHTPFEKSGLHFLVNCDIATHIQMIKHRVGVSVNAESARYKELKEDKFYIPEVFLDVPIDPSNRSWLQGYNNWGEVLYDQSLHSNALYHACLADVQKQHGRKRAKESARFFKMYNSQITSDMMFNWRSFAHFLNLRCSEHAQKEIAALATQMLTLVKSIVDDPFKHTITAFGL